MAVLRGEKRRGFWALGALLFLSGCAAPPRVTAPRTSPADILADARAEGLEVSDPLGIDPDMIEDVDRVVGFSGTPEERLRRLWRYVKDDGVIGFRYEAAARSLTAREAYRAKQGDCVSFALLYAALARHLDVPVYFVYIRKLDGYFERNGSFYLSSHVAVGYGTGPMAVVIDLKSEAPDWSLSLYNTIDDGTLFALYANNLAVDAMQSGSTAEAEKMLRFWLARRPNVGELYNNLGVLLNRKGQYEEALALLERGIKEFPAYESLYTNAVRAARGAGRYSKASALLARASMLAEGDPLLLLTAGVHSFQAGDLEKAAERIEKAGDVLPDSPVIAAWLVRVYLTAGKRERAESAFARVRKLAPEGRLERDLRREFPELGRL